MKVLVGCECSQIVTEAFIKKGHKAMSCDLLPGEKGLPHHQGDIIDLIKDYSFYVDLIILHPDCTKLAVSGNRWYGKGKARHNERIQAIWWTNKLWELAKKRSRMTCLENPVSVIFKNIRYDALQYIQPWQFGHGETKKTGLALNNLPPLEPTNIVDGRKQRIWKMPPSESRKKERSITYQGIANAMAKQWE